MHQLILQAVNAYFLFPSTVPTSLATPTIIPACGGKNSPGPQAPHLSSEQTLLKNLEQYRPIKLLSVHRPCSFSFTFSPR
ncbi:hypothetical protein BC830DRAFT_1154770 [Chytriomyces sp. MP71]|nr:hypothetical protein BC830DRAFT_1154770 [Chytriomyces sp. MP71]